MDYANVEKSIDLICEKFGIVANEAEELITKLAEYKITMGWVSVGAAVFCFLLIGLMLWKAEWIGEQDLEFLAMLIGIVCAGIGIICAITGIIEIVSWTNIPEIKAIQYFLNAAG
jgi:hypothetical protein